MKPKPERSSIELIFMDLNERVTSIAFLKGSHRANHGLSILPWWRNPFVMTASLTRLPLVLPLSFLMRAIVAIEQVSGEVRAFPLMLRNGQGIAWQLGRYGRSRRVGRSRAGR